MKKNIKENYPNTEGGNAGFMSCERQMTSFIDNCNDCLLLLRIIESITKRLSIISENEMNNNKRFTVVKSWADRVYDEVGMVIANTKTYEDDALDAIRRSGGRIDVDDWIYERGDDIDPLQAEDIFKRAMKKYNSETNINENMRKNTMKIDERALKQIVAESVKRVLREMGDDMIDYEDCYDPDEEY